MVFLEPGQKLEYGWDTVTAGTYVECAGALDKTANHKLATILPGFDYSAMGDINYEAAYVANAHKGTDAEKDFASAFCKQLTKWLQEGKYAAHPYKIIDGGLNGVLKGLQLLKDNKVSASKCIFKIAE